jgi:uncharacterized RDD family membrane protein YckC
MQNIQIQTAQHVSISYELASFRDRLLALGLDLILILFCYLGLFVWNFELNLAYGDSRIFQLLLIPMLLLYQFISENLGRGQSAGKYIMGIKVIRRDGRPATSGDYLLRTFFHLIDTLGSLGVIGSFLISSTPDKQRLGDITAGTVVIKFRRKPELRLEQLLELRQLKNHDPVYLQVTQLKENEILLIKNALSRYQAFPNLAHKEALEQLIERLSKILDIRDIPADKLEFLKTLINDYIVLTR